MKKIAAILLVLCMCVGFCGCGQPADNDKVTEPQKSNVIELNTNNVSQYLEISIGDPENDGKYRGDYKCPIKIYPLQGGTFSNVDVVLTISTDWRCLLRDATGATIQLESKRECDGKLEFKLPADGRYELYVKVSDYDAWSADEPISKCDFLNVSGTFTPANK